MKYYYTISVAERKSADTGNKDRRRSENEKKLIKRVFLSKREHVLNVRCNSDLR